MTNLAKVYRVSGRKQEAIQLLEQALALSKRLDHPETLELMSSLAADYSDVGRSEEAIALCEECLKLQKSRLGLGHPRTWSSIDSLFRAYVIAGRLGNQNGIASDSAMQLLTDMLTPAGESQPTSAPLLRARAGFLARLGCANQAIADLSQAVRLEPENHDLYHVLAPLLVETGDRDAYRSHCAKVVELFGKTTEPYVAERMAKDCLILTPSGVELDLVQNMADTAIGAGENHDAWSFFQFVKGLCEYRQGRFASSVKWMQSALTRPGEVAFRDAQAQLVLAMAHYQLNEAEQARAALAEGDNIIRSKSTTAPGVLKSDWSDWLIAQALLREASALIEPLPGQE
jgi:tetratricopeptide (TPR) repeat protein